MAFRVRKFHSLLLGFIGLCLVAYSSYFSSSGLLFLDSTVTDVDTASDHFSHTALKEKIETQKYLVNTINLRAEVKKVSENVMPSDLSTKFHSTAITTPKEKNIMTLQNSVSGIHHVTTTATQSVEGVAVVTENSTTNISSQQMPAHVQRAVSSPVQAIVQNPPRVSAQGTVQSAAHGSSSNIAPVVSNSVPDSVGKAILTWKIYEPEFHASTVNLCPNLGQNIRLLVIVTSAPTHRDARMAIRYTWGHFRQRKDVSIGFLVGSVNEMHKQQLIDDETSTYNDLIQSKFLDSYNNLTLKTISLLEWVDTYCNKAKFILKTDDDMFINVPRLLAFIDKHNNDKRTIFGRLAKRWKPIRNKASKYYVSLDQYKPPIFPDFTTGPAYLLTSDIIHDMYKTALNKTYLKLEDVFLTGIVAQEMKVKRIHVSEFLNKRITLNACGIQKGISIHMIKYPEQFDLWKKLLDGKSKCS